jgi:predicted nucleic acid-binding protein
VIQLKILFDTSVLIASSVEVHPKHEPALLWLKRAKNKEFDAFLASHSVLEFYSILTSAPFKPKISPDLAKQLIDTNLRKNFITTSLEPEEYYFLIDLVSTAGFIGGIVYDALIYECARKSNADKILTLNVKDFSRLNTDKKIDVISV